MKVLIFDTETTGLLPRNIIINFESIKTCPHIVQISWVLYDTNKNALLNIGDYIVKMPDDVNIPDEAAKIHKITNEISQERGILFEEVFNEFATDFRSCDLIVGHNLEFDKKMLHVEILRLANNHASVSNKYDIIGAAKILTKMTQMSHYCTMRNSIELCAIKRKFADGTEYNKFPTLLELHEKLFLCAPKNLHNSLNDVLITLRCYFMLTNKFDLARRNIQFRNLIVHL